MAKIISTHDLYKVCLRRSPLGSMVDMDVGPNLDTVEDMYAFLWLNKVQADLPTSKG